MACARWIVWAALLSTVVALRAEARQAGQPAGQAAPAAAPASAGPDSNWITRCTSRTRAGALECTIEQSVIKTDTRQVVALLRVRMPPETRAPVMMMQLPLGLYLPAGVALTVDDVKVSDLPVQTCDAGGCYASSPLPSAVLAQLQNGKTLRVSFQNLSRETIDVTMPLTGFSTAYEGIK
jgi:invasion protein IalB